MVQDFGRRQPAAFMGAMALMGFAASRFLMASAQRQAPASLGEDYSGAGVGDGGITGNYRGSSRGPSGMSSSRDTMGGSF
jgi:hypothetical protein